MIRPLPSSTLFPYTTLFRSSFAISGTGSSGIAFIAQDSYIVINLSALRLTGQRFLESVQGSGILMTGIKTQSEIAIGLSIRGIDAERSSRFRDCFVGIVVTIEDVG